VWDPVSHSVTSTVSGQHDSFPSGFPQTLGADGLPRPDPTHSKPNTEAFPQPLHYKTLPPPWSASSPPWRAVPAGSWWRGSGGEVEDDAGTPREHRLWSPTAPRSWDRPCPTAPTSSARLLRPPPGSRPGRSS